MIDRLVERKGARVVSAAGEGTDASDPASVLMRQIIDAFAQYERAVIRTRTKAALRAKRARGERAGNVPFGHQLAKDGIRLEPNEHEINTLSVIREWRARGASLRQIAAELNRRGMRTRRGTPWTFNAVGGLLAA
jgi:DNA invertase Pin-like site-specific DNA recombinase